MAKVSWKSTFAELTILRLLSSLSSTILVKYATTGPKWAPFKQVQKIREIAIVCSRCRQNGKCGNFTLLSFLQRTTRSYSKRRAASAARLFFTMRLSKFLTCDAFTPFAIVAAKMNKNKRFACSSRAFFFISVHFFPVLCKSASWNDHFSRFTGNVAWTHRREFVFSFLALTPQR